MIKIADFTISITNEQQGEEILKKINIELSKNETVEIDFKGIIAMTTFCAKQIFGNLYVKLSPSIFFKRIKLLNVSDDLKLIINQGIESAVNDK